MTIHWSASASTSDTSYHCYSGTACTNEETYVTHINTSSATASWNGWYIEGHDEYGENYKLQFAHYPSAFPRYKVRKVKCSSPIATMSETGDYITSMPEIITVEYAPLDEMSEVEPTKFNEFLERLRTDPEYRKQQLAMQDRLFLSEKMLGMWTIDGFNLLHRFLEHFRGDIDVQHARDLILNLFQHAQQLVGQPGFTQGQMAAEFMGVPARYEELRSLHEIFMKYPKELIEEVYQKRKEMIEAQEHLIEHAETTSKIPPLTVEQLHAISVNAERLLREVLTPAEYDGLIKDGHVRIPSQQDPEVIYLVKRIPSERIEVHRNGKLAEKLCIYFKTELPDDDLTLTKIMMLKQNEAELLKIANHFKVEDVMTVPNHVEIRGVEFDGRTPPIEVRTP